MIQLWPGCAGLVDNIWWEHFLDTCHGSDSNQSDNTLNSSHRHKNQPAQWDHILCKLRFCFSFKILKGTNIELNETLIFYRVQVRISRPFSLVSNGLSLWLVSRLSSHKVRVRSSGLSSLISPGRAPLLDRVKRGNLVMKIMFQMNQSPVRRQGSGE